MLLLEPNQIFLTPRRMQAVVCGMVFTAGLMIELSHTDDKGQEKQG